MVVHVFDVNLAKEWLNTLKEYAGFLLKPPLGIMSIWNPLRTESLKDWFTTWSVVQFWWGIVINIASVLLMVLLIDSSGLISAIVNSVVGVITAFLWAYIGWFGIEKKDGCCCFVVVCITDMPLLYLIYGIWLILWGALAIVNSTLYISVAALGFVYTICYGSYGVPLIYMGLACVKLFLANKDDPSKGATSEVVIGKPDA